MNIPWFGKKPDPTSSSSKPEVPLPSIQDHELIMGQWTKGYGNEAIAWVTSRKTEEREKPGHSLCLIIQKAPSAQSNGTLDKSMPSGTRYEIVLFWPEEVWGRKHSKNIPPQEIALFREKIAALLRGSK